MSGRFGSDNFSEKSSIFVRNICIIGRISNLINMELKNGEIKMKRLVSIILLLTFVFGITSCSGNDPESKIESVQSDGQSVGESSATSGTENSSLENPDVKEEKKLNISVNGHILKADLADTQAAKELYELIKNKPLELTLSEYGSFEKVGKLPQSFTKSDQQINAQPGDIMLYQGNQMTIFYGENSWSYTRLGKIENITAEELTEIFGDGDVTIIISDQSFEQ